MINNINDIDWQIKTPSRSRALSHSHHPLQDLPSIIRERHPLGWSHDPSSGAAIGHLRLLQKCAPVGEGIAHAFDDHASGMEEVYHFGRRLSLWIIQFVWLSVRPFTVEVHLAIR